MAYTDTETQDTFCHYTDVKFSSVPPRERRGSFKSNELSLYPNHHSQSSSPPPLTSRTFTSVSYCSRSLTIRLRCKSVHICNTYVYVHVCIYGYICVYNILTAIKLCISGFLMKNCRTL